MSYTIRNVYDLGVTYTGKTLNAQIVNDAGANVGSVISSLFREVATGIFEHVCSIPDNQTGFLRIYATDAPSEFVVVLPINPIEIEANAVQVEVNDALVSYGALNNNDLSTIEAAIIDITSIIAVNNPPVYDAGRINIKSGTTYYGVITGISIMPSNWTKAIFTIKNKLSDSDNNAILKISVSNPGSGSDGLQVLNGQSNIVSPTTYLSVDYNTKSATINISDDITSQLSEAKHKYDIKFLYGSSNSCAIAYQDCHVTKMVTQET